MIGHQLIYTLRYFRWAHQEQLGRVRLRHVGHKMKHVAEDDTFRDEKRTLLTSP